MKGIGMLAGSVADGFIAQMTNLGVPYVIRSIMLALTLVVAAVLMRDLGFDPVRGKEPMTEVKRVLRESLQGGFGTRPVRWLMLEAPFTMGVGIFAFYAMQPYLLELYGDETAFGVAGLAAAVVAGAQIVGGYGASYTASAAITALAIPFVVLARREDTSSDPISRGDAVPDVDQPAVPPEGDTLPG